MLKGKNFLLKRVISCVLVCAMILGLIPQSVYAAPSEGTDTQKTYSSDGFTITYKEASAWDNYVNAEITLANDTDSAKSLWEIQFSYDGEIDSIWNADIKNHDAGTYVLEAKNIQQHDSCGAVRNPWVYGSRKQCKTCHAGEHNICRCFGFGG